MSLYHFSVKQISRGKGQTVVGSAAYISGQKLHNNYYEEIHDYTRKQGVIFDEIMLPDYVPDRFSDRQTLWNEVEFAEKGKRAQLAYSFNIALQNELTMEENVELAREFCREQFVGRGMIVDMAVHEGESSDPEIADNPHFHVLVPIRPMNPDGTWGRNSGGSTSWTKMETVSGMKMENISFLLFPLPAGIPRNFWKNGESSGRIKSMRHSGRMVWQQG